MHATMIQSIHSQSTRLRRLTTSAKHTNTRHLTYHRLCQCLVSLQQMQLKTINPRTGCDDLPQEPGIYAVYDGEEDLQFIGITRKVTPRPGVPDLTRSIRYEVKTGATREELVDGWKEVIQSYVNEKGALPPGNQPGNTAWKPKGAPRPKPEIKLTPGKGIEDVTISMEELIDKVVKDCKVVAFIKGTRTQPECGFSYQVLTILNQNRVDYEVVNVLDEVHNPTLREKIKEYSQWPTIPQLYVNGEFVGGSDIINQMQEEGELQKLLQSTVN